MSSAPFAITPIPVEEADRLRRLGGPTYVADSHPGYPCRQCLRDAAIGEELILVSHDPFTVDSPYRSASPIFLHRAPCTPFVDDGTLPEQLTSRQLSVRGFDAQAMMLDAALIDGSQLHETLVRLFDDPEIQRIHVHNAGRGCWATSVARSPG